MDIYTLGRLALPVVLMIMAVSAVLTLVGGLFTAVKTFFSMQRFLQKMEQSGQPSVTINIDASIVDACIANTGRRASKPPMQAKE